MMADVNFFTFILEHVSRKRDNGRHNILIGALILEHVSEIMADTCNVNTRQKKNIK